MLCACSTALDAALEFQQQFVVPSTWKTEVKEESSSSEDDDEDEEEEQEEDASGEEEEVKAEACTRSSKPQFPNWESVSNGLVSCLQEEVEPFPEERENFLQQLYKFMEDRGELSVHVPAFFVGLYPSVPLLWTQYLRNSLMEGLQIWPDQIVVVRVKVTV